MSFQFISAIRLLTIIIVQYEYIKLSIKIIGVIDIFATKVVIGKGGELH